MINYEARSYFAYSLDKDVTEWRSGIGYHAKCISTDHKQYLYLKLMT
jgi:hypothetical protein